MQLPRGTFREIRKGETIENLFLELERSKFSGICSISSGSGSGTLVLKTGKCILIKFKGKSGDAGWEELQMNRTEEIDAALSTLDDAQIQLSLEFNKICRLIKGGKNTQEQARPVHQPPVDQVKKPAPPVRPPAPLSSFRPTPKPAAPVTPLYRPAVPVQQPVTPEPRPQNTLSPHQRPAMPAPPVHDVPARKSPEKPPIPGDEDPETGGSSSFDKDIDTFDTMDLDNVTDKIRNDCKTMIKQLHLEHLMER